MQMRKIFNKSYWIGFVSSMVLTSAGLIACWLCTREEKADVKEIVDSYAIADVDTLVLDDLYMGMTEEEFIREMEKGVQGDYTLEQVDSLQLDLALFNHGVPDSIIKIWRDLSDKQKLDAILGTATEDIRIGRRDGR